MTSDLNFLHRYEPGDPEKPVVLALHGTGGTENDLVSLAKSLFPGCGVLSPRGKVLENGMPRFFRRLAEGVFDQEDLAFRTGELAGFIEDARREYQFTSKVVALGYSNGANIAASLLLSRPDALQGAVLLRAMMPFEVAEPPALEGVPIYLAAGRQDPLVAVSNVEKLASILRNGGAAVTLAVANAGHNLAGEEMEAIKAWIASNSR